MSVDVNVREAKARLSELLERVERGEEVVIRKRQKAIARLVASEARRRPGRLKGRIRIADDFDETPEELVEMMENGPI